MLELLPVPLGCEDCDNLAYWSFDDQPICYSHLRTMAGMTSDNEAAVFEALISPVIVHSTRNRVALAIYPTTCTAPICAMLNQLFFLLPELDSEAEICIDLLEEKRWMDGVRIECQGRGYYYLDSTTVRCHAPLIKLARAPVGRMVGFMKMLNDHSLRIRQCLEQEFREIPT